MQQCSNANPQSNIRLLQPFKLPQPPRWRMRAAIISLSLALTTLACAFLEVNPRSASERPIILTRLATLTPTMLAPSPTPSLVTESASIAATPIPLPTVTPASSNIPTATSLPQSNMPMLTALVDLNVRAGPGLDYAVVGQLSQGQSTQITAKNPEETWWQIVYPPASGSLAWVAANAQYVSVSHAEGLPIAQAPVPATATLAPTQAPAAVGPTPILQPTLDTLGWSFDAIRVDASQEDGLLLYGNMINNTSSSQEIDFITGTFYDAQGQVIAGEEKIFDHWLIGVVPPGGWMPFELTVPGIQNAANLDLRVEAEPSDETPRRDFEFADIISSAEPGAYCLSGSLRNPGGELQDYLIIIAVLYDQQDNIINFGEYDEPYFDEVIGDQALDFELCIDPLDQQVARHELQAWGS